jgi:hypothetical protein
MGELQEADLVIQVPHSMRSITLEQYQKYVKVLENNKGAEHSDFVGMKFVEIFCSTSLENIKNIHFSVFEEVGNILGEAFKQETPLVRHFKIGDVEFGFMPNVSKMSIGEYIDIEHTIGDWSNVHKAMAVLFRPIKKKKGDKYTIKKYSPTDTTTEAMKQMPLDVVLGARVFFYHLGKDLLHHTLSYLEKEVLKTNDKQISQEMLRLQKSGVGISQFIDSLTETPKTLTRQQK